VKPLRIAQVAPIATGVSPTATGSIEQIVWLLTEELVRRGHDVTLFATGDSETSARLASLYARGYNDDHALWDWMFHEVLHMAAVFERAEQFDIVHSHAYHFGLPFTRLVATPVVHTYHVLPDEDILAGYARHPEANLVAVSEFQRSQLDGVGGHLPVVHHGIDVETFPFRARGGDYLLFLGRLNWQKGPVEAIRVARASGMRLVLAGPDDDDEAFVREHIAPEVERGAVDHVGWVGRRKRNALLARAGALVYPINYPETFGLVLIEAMACGTPVLALDRGAVGEIVDDGVTGFVRSDVEGLVEAVPRALALDRRAVRGRARERFGHSRMTDDYEALYERLAGRRIRRIA
jgi:glycosyltransferase involved in cell wall biosynthesis